MRPFIIILSFLCIAELSAQSLDLPLITITGSAVLFENPDEVLLSVNLYEKDMNLAMARASYQKKSKEVISFLKNLGIKSEHIQSQHTSVGPKRRRNSTEIDHYYASQTINVCLRNLDKYDQLINGLVDLDVHKVSQSRFRSDEISSLKSKALKLAIVDAKQKANMLAEEIGQRIGKAKIINEVPITRTSFNAETYGSSQETITGAVASEGFAPGQLEIKSQVKVSFELL